MICIAGLFVSLSGAHVTALRIPPHPSLPLKEKKKWVRKFYSKVVSKLITATGKSGPAIIFNWNKVKPRVIHSLNSVNVLILLVDQLAPLDKERS